MADTTADIAKASVEASLASGVSISEGNLSVTRANVRDAYDIAEKEKASEAAKGGRRPLFRGINLAGMGY